MLDKFWRFHHANPKIYTFMLKYSLELVNTRRRTHYGMQQVIERIRWEWYTGALTSVDEFKISNDHGACYSRMLMMQEPSLYGFFRTCTSYADALEVNGETWLAFVARKERESTDQFSATAAVVDTDGEEETTIQ